MAKINSSHWFTLFAVLSSLSGACTADLGDDVADSDDESFFTDVGKADAYGVEEGTYLAEAILHVANTFSSRQLRTDVHVASRTANNIVDARARGGEYGSLTELDAVPSTGPIFFERIRTYVESKGLVHRCGDGTVETIVEVCDDGNVSDGDACDSTCRIATVAAPGSVHGYVDLSYEGIGIVRAANYGSAADFEGAGLTVEVSKRLDYDYDTSTLRTLADLDAVVGVDAPQFELLLALARVRNWLPSCGDRDVTEGLETCDDGNVVDFDGCSATCTPEFVCGDGVATYTRYESCDDGNVLDGDGCSSLCSWEGVEGTNGRGAKEMAPFRFAYDATASGYHAVGDTFTYTVSQRTLVGIDLAVRQSSSYGREALDAFRSSMSRSHVGAESDSSTRFDAFATVSVDDHHANAEVDPRANVRRDGTEVPGWGGWDRQIQLNPGTHTIHVFAQGSGRGTNLVGFSLQVVALSTSGPLCGDGVVASPEACDDGNTISNDGCSAACNVLETYSEVESNDSVEAANNARAFRELVGSASYADRDVFRVELATPMTATVLSPDGACHFDYDLDVLAEDGTLLTTDDRSGLDDCPLLSLTAGTHLLAVRLYSPRISGGEYRLSIR